MTEFLGGGVGLGGIRVVLFPFTLLLTGIDTGPSCAPLILSKLSFCAGMACDILFEFGE
jgi:hypothetical protein